MDIGALTHESCGLYFLAGLDSAGGGGRPGMVTIHAAQGALTEDNLRAIRAAVAALRPGFDTYVKLHSEQELRAPDSLESFARQFRHEQILVDPTGSFRRVSELLALGRQIRAEFGSDAGRILWQADTSSLIVVAGRDSQPSRLDFRLQQLIERSAFPELRGVVRAVGFCADVPAGRYTPLDARSIDSGMRRSGFSKLLLRLSGAAALFGLGTISAAHASAHAALDETGHFLPGITGLVGLTTLGESAFGPRNRYQAVGGLRLYFGDAGGILVAALGAPLPAAPGAAAGTPVNQAEPAPTTVPPKPVRIAYGG